MKAAIVYELGDTPRYGDFEEPQIQGDEVNVSVTATAVKQLDRAIVAGTHYSSPKIFPIVPGTDGVGRLPDGSRVYFAANRRPFGALAERSPASWTAPVPCGVDDYLSAALVNPAFGAWLPLGWRGGLTAGETVMIMGATGTTGSLAVKAARLMGAGRIIACGRRLDVLEQLGADASVDLSLPEDALRAAFAREAGHGLDLIIDYVWGRPAELLIDVLTAADLHGASESDAGVRLVSVGAMAGANICLPSAALRGSRLSLLGSGTANFPPVAQMQALVGEILGHAAKGELGLNLDVHPLSDVEAVWRQPQSDRRIVFRL